MSPAYYTWETDCGILSRRYLRSLLLLTTAGLLNACGGGGEQAPGGGAGGAVTCATGAAPAVLTWDAVTNPSLAGYRIHYGTTRGTYPQFLDVGSVTIYTVTTGLNSGTTYYFVATAYDSSNPPNESGFSNEVCKVIS